MTRVRRKNLGLGARISGSREKTWIHVETHRSRKVESIDLKKKKIISASERSQNLPSTAGVGNV